MAGRSVVGMNVREAMTLKIAAAQYGYPAQREEDFVRLVGYTPPRAFQVVNSLLNRADAEAEMPQAVHRLRRVRELRTRARTAS